MLLATTALITGASRGLGLALARELLVATPDDRGDESVRVILTASTQAAALGAAAALRREGLEDVHGCILDVSNPRSIAAFAQEHGEIDLLINNAAVCPSGWSRESTRSCWRTNVFGPLTLTRALLPSMLRRRRGHVVHISSGDGELLYLHSALQAELRAATSEWAVLRVLARATPPHNAFGHAPAHGPTPAYAASKAALNALTRIAAARPPPPPPQRSFAWSGGKMSTNREEATEAFLERVSRGETAELSAEQRAAIARVADS